MVFLTFSHYLSSGTVASGNWLFLPILRFSKSISAQMGDLNILFWLDWQFNYYTVEPYAVWRNFDQSCYARGDLNIEICLKLRHIKLIDKSCWSDTWSNNPHFMFFHQSYIYRIAATFVFSISLFVWQDRSGTWA